MFVDLITDIFWQIFSGRYFAHGALELGIPRGSRRIRTQRDPRAHLPVSEPLERLRVRLDELALADLGACGHFGVHQVKEQLHVAQIREPTEVTARRGAADN